MTGTSKLGEIEVIQIASQYVKLNGLHATEVDRVSFVDASTLPDRLKQKGSFWIVGFRDPFDGDVVAEHDGLVLNISDANGEVTMI